MDVLAKTAVVAATGNSTPAIREPEEKVLLDEDGIKVTTARFMVKDHTYSMAGITSVKTGVEHPSKIGPFVTIAFGGLGLISSLNDHSGSALGLGAMGLAMLAVGIAWLRSKRPEYTVVLTSASGETEPYDSEDDVFVERIVKEINDAIVHRG